MRECDFYMDGECGCDFEVWNGEIMSYSNCSNIKDCYYKQLKRIKTSLNKIEEVCKNGAYNEYRMPLDECGVILDIINNTKEG